MAYKNTISVIKFLVYVSQSSAASQTGIPRILKLVFEKSNITQLHRHHRVPRSFDAANSILDQVGQYGCWCQKMQAGQQALQGAPIDSIDEACRSWSQCRNCEHFTACTGELDENYTPTIAIDPVTFGVSYSCDNMNDCTTAS